MIKGDIVRKTEYFMERKEVETNQIQNANILLSKKEFRISRRDIPASSICYLTYEKSVPSISLAFVTKKTSKITFPQKT